MPTDKDDKVYSEKKSQERFRRCATWRAQDAHEPLKEKPKVRTTDGKKRDASRRKTDDDPNIIKRFLAEQEDAGEAKRISLYKQGQWLRLSVTDTQSEPTIA